MVEFVQTPAKSTIRLLRSTNATFQGRRSLKIGVLNCDQYMAAVAGQKAIRSDLPISHPSHIIYYDRSLVGGSTRIFLKSARYTTSGSVIVATSADVTPMSVSLRISNGNGHRSRVSHSIGSAFVYVTK